jgi:hypothetical protein
MFNMGSRSASHAHAACGVQLGARESLCIGSTQGAGAVWSSCRVYRYFVLFLNKGQGLPFTGTESPDGTCLLPVREVRLFSVLSS